VNPGGPTTTVVLDALPSAPAAISNLWCQQADMRLLLSWERSQGFTVAGYRVYDLGDLTPAADADITEKYKVGDVPHPEPVRDAAGGLIETGLVRYEFLERVYKLAASDGATVELDLDAAAVLLEVDALAGRKVTFLLSDGTSTSLTAVSNTERTITFASAPTDTGAQILLRDADGVHHLYVRVFDKAGVLSTAKPIPPAVLMCFPYARDGSKDVDVPRLYTNPSIILGTTDWSLGYPSGRAGAIWVQACARSADEAEADFDAALKQNIGGINLWRVEIYLSSVEGGPSDELIVREVAASTKRENYFHRDDIFGTFWQLNNYLGYFECPHKWVAEVRVQARNSWGWSPAITAQTVGTASQWWTGGDSAALRQEIAAIGGGGGGNEYEISPFESLSRTIVIPAVGASGAIIKFPLVQPQIGMFITYRIPMSATPGPVTFQNTAGGSFVRMTDLKIPEEPGSVTWITFYALGPTQMEPCNVQTFYA
jgi:hypothetical protein